MSVFHHARYVQILHTYETWLSFHNVRSDLMNVIRADVRQPVMNTQEFLFLFGYIRSFTVFSFLLDFPAKREMERCNPRCRFLSLRTLSRWTEPRGL